MNYALYSMLFNEKDKYESYCASKECSICPRKYDCLDRRRDYSHKEETDKKDADRK